MKRKSRTVLLGACLGTCAVAPALAASGQPVKDFLSAEIKVLREQAAATRGLLGGLLGGGSGSELGQAVKYLGAAGSGIVYLQPDCSSSAIGTLGPDDHCLVVNPGTPVSFEYDDIGRLTIPGKSSKDIVCFWYTNFVYREFENPNSTPLVATLAYQPTVTLEAAALSDPRAVDPNTGLPYNGKIDLGSMGSHTVTRTLQAGDIDADNQQYSRTCISGYTKASFTDPQGFGLPPDLADRLFKEPMTFHINIRGYASGVGSALLFANARFLGD